MLTVYGKYSKYFPARGHLFRCVTVQSSEQVYAALSVVAIDVSVKQDEVNR